MKMITGRHASKERTFIQIFTESPSEEEVIVRGAVHAIRDMGEIVFVILRRAEGLLQCVWEPGAQEASHETLLPVQGSNPLPVPGAEDGIHALREESAVELSGLVRTEPRAPHGRELCIRTIRILSVPFEPLPVCINKWKLSSSLETQLNLRGITLRNVRERAKFRIQEGIVRGFRDFLHGQGFTEIRTPKIVARGAEGGANIFRLEYFGKKAELAQSPQFYKQTLAGVYDRVFEVAPVFRAEKHNTTRHLNEYTSMDFEMAYIDSFEELMETETAMLRYVMELLQTEYQKELELLKVALPKAGEIPQVRFSEAKRLAAEKYGRPMRNPNDLEPEEEQLIGRYFKEEYGSDFVFVTHYPSKKRPFYAMDDPDDPKVTLSFDLLFRGLEITTGGQRIHEYEMLLEKMKKRNMNPEDIASYLMIFRYGMPPHGGLGIGLERLTMRLLGEDNVRETTFFPRDVNRLEP